MTTSESKCRFFSENESIRIDLLNESNRIDSNRELECSTRKSMRHQKRVYLEFIVPNNHHVCSASSLLISLSQLVHTLQLPVSNHQRLQISFT